MLLFSLSLNAQDTINNYLKTAAENSAGLKAKFNKYMAAMQRIPQVGALPDPSFAFGYFIQPVETRVGPQQAKLSLTQTFPWFGTLGARKDIATQQAKAKYEVFEEAKSKLFYEIKSVWYNLYFTNRAIAITKENITILNTFQKLALIKIEAGTASSVDELRIEMELLDLKNQLALLNDKLKMQKIEFKNLLNVSDTFEVIIPEKLQTDIDKLQNYAQLDSIRLNNHLVLQSEFLQASYEYRQIEARKAGKPVFSVGIDYTFIGASSNPSLPAGESGKDAIMFPKIGITIPVYRKKYTAMVKEAVFLQQAEQNNKIDRINILETLFEKAKVDYNNAVRRLTLHQKQTELAKKAMRILESEYAANGKNFEEILRMERQVLMHNLELEKSKTDLNASLAFIDYLSGR